MSVNRRHLALGLAAIVAAMAFGGVVVAALAGKFGGRTYPVTVSFDRAGQLLETGGDVKLRGVLVGTISGVTLTADGRALITLAMYPAQRVPHNVTASIRGKTLFGEKFIELRDAGPTEGVLRAGDEITETVEPFELESVLEAALPLLDAVSPGDLGGALAALAEGLAGQEEEARRAIDNGLVALRSLNAHGSDLDRLLAGLDETSGALGRAAPDFVDALGDLDAFNRTVIANAGDVRGALAGAPTWLDALARIVEARYPDLVDLSLRGADILDLVVVHKDALPGTVTALRNFTQAWVETLSVGCADKDGRTIGEVHPSLEGSTCWQIWQLTAEEDKVPGGYTGEDQPSPDGEVAARAYRAQLRRLLGLRFPREASDLAAFLYEPLRDEGGLIPEGVR